jgi:ligand-binding sensor domain-containing protein/signal transduction histidine kinase
MCGYGCSVSNFFRYTRFKLPPILLLTILLVSCSGADASLPPTVEQSSPQLGIQAQTAAPLPPNATLHFDSISLEDGLSQSVVNVILQDRRGFLWFGTQDGLNRYDGYNFKVYKPDPEDPKSLSDGWVASLFEDKDGFIWIGTYQGGLNKYDPSTDTFTQFRHIPEDPSSISEGMINAILQDHSGMLWVGSEGGLNKFDPISNSFIHYRHDPNDPKSLSRNSIHVIYQDQKDNLWIGTLGGGLELFDPLTGGFRHFQANTETEDETGKPNEETLLQNDETLSNNYVKKIIEDAKGNLWIGTEKGLNYFDPVRGQFQHFLYSDTDSSTISNNSVAALLVDSVGRLWVGTEFGLNRFDETSGKFIRYYSNPLIANSLSNNAIFSLYEDREGILWIGTWGAGINKHSPAQNKFTLYRYDPENPQSIPAEGVFGIEADPSGIAWFGSPGGGLTRFDPASGLATHYQNDPNDSNSLASPKVWTVYRDQAGTLWVGTSYGLDRMDERTGKFTHHKVDKDKPVTSIRSNFVTQIYESPDGSFWIGTGMGLDLYERSTGIFTHIVDPADPQGATSANVGAIFEDSEGFLWVGTSGAGAYRFDKKNNTFHYYQTDPTDPKSLSHNIILAIYQDKHGTIWLATGGGGLNRYDPETDSFTTLTERQGLPNNFIYCIVPDEQNNLWLTTNFGISRFDPLKETFENFTANDGLQSNEFNSNACARNANGDIYVGGTLGVNLFNPSKISLSSYIPPIALTSLTQSEKPIQIATPFENIREITLTWPKNSFEFEFASLSFAEPKKNQYAYILEGFDSEWNNIGNKHEGRYTNLPGGEYVLRLKGSNNDYQWNEDGVALKIIVVPPFWQTWWFLTLTGIVVLAGVWAGYRLRIRSIELRRQELERQVVERTREIERLFEQMKELAIVEERNRLARELHDSAKQKAFAALAQIGAASGLIQRNANAAQIHIKEAEDLVHDVIQELTFLIQEMYPMALKEKGLVVTLREYAFEWESRNTINISLQVEGEHQLPLKVEQALYRISQESLANIARHSHASHVAMSLSYNAEKVSLTIRDDGCGFDMAQKPKGVGLRSIKERAESIGGQIIIESIPNKGTRVEVTIPIA